MLLIAPFAHCMQFSSTKLSKMTQILNKFPTVLEINAARRKKRVENVYCAHSNRLAISKTYKKKMGETYK